VAVEGRQVLLDLKLAMVALVAYLQYLDILHTMQEAVEDRMHFLL
jgi:hypothetical protein